MEEINQEIFQMITDLRSMHHRQQSINVDENTRDSCGFPFEPDDSFTMDPLGYLETAMKQYAQAEETFRLLRVLNRHSPLFWQTAAEFEKTLSQLGSACITKAVMEQQGQTFLLLDKLTIGRLRNQTAFLFRKSYASFMESMGKLGYNGNALKFSNRFAALDKRLIATDEKISLIRAGKIKYKLICKDEYPEPQGEPEVDDEQQSADSSAADLTAAETVCEKENITGSFSGKGRSFSADKACVLQQLRTVREAASSDNENNISDPACNEKMNAAPVCSGEGTSHVEPEPEKSCPAVSSEKEHAEEPVFREDVLSDVIPAETEETDIGDCLCIEEEGLPDDIDNIFRKMSEYVRLPGSEEMASPEYEYTETSPP